MWIPRIVRARELRETLQRAEFAMKRSGRESRLLPMRAEGNLKARQVPGRRFEKIQSALQLNKSQSGTAGVCWRKPRPSLERSD